MPDHNSSTPHRSEQQEDTPKRKPARWPWVVAGLVLVVFVAVVLVRIFAPKPDVWTDDAYVTVHYVTVAPRVPGQVATVQVNDNQLVKTGQILLTLDPRDYQASLAMAEATLERDQALLIDASATVARQPALILEQEAAFDAARARFDFARINKKRYENLAATGAGTAQQHQEADSTLAQDEASLQGTTAALEAARRQMDILRAQVLSAQATVASDKARLEQAKLNLSYTRIVAPLDGMVGEKTVQVGNYVSSGAVMLTVVPLDQMYIQANYRELDLRHVRSGQHVTIHVDAYDIDLDGIVDSVPPASGAVFSPIPPNNATGNFTKIVQRLPVKIVVSPTQKLAKLLRVGFSVETTIHTGLEDVVGEQNGSLSRVTAH
ncbi:MAG: rane fusion protein multidrug efflux system [Acetobacteraceae bacterium]|nr:rane fusion protein multidrug efflux system [Acetobacteraceae bacterium]